LVFRIPIGTLGADWYFECQLVLRVPIVTSNADCYFEYQSSNNPPTRTRISTSNTNWYFEYQLVLRIPKLVLRIPIVTSNTICYFQYQLLLRMPWVTIHHPTRYLKCCWSDLLLKSDQKIWYDFDLNKSTFSDHISKSDQKNSRTKWCQNILIRVWCEWYFDKGLMWTKFLISIWFQNEKVQLAQLVRVCAHENNLKKI
jgi:hypothetical protein